MTKIIRSM